MGKICGVYEETVCGIRTAVIENDLLRARVLIGKGADIYEIIYKPQSINILMRKSYGLEQYKDLDLSKNRLSWYGEKYTGGWNDVVPDRGTYAGKYLVQKNSGIASTMPWNYNIVEDKDDKVEICCFVHTPEFPLYIEKRIIVEAGASRITVLEHAVNEGDEPMEFTWTQHVSFGGDYLDESVRIWLPADKALNAYEFHERTPNDPQKIEDYEYDVRAVRFKDGSVYDLTKGTPRAFAGEHFVTMRNLREGRARLIHEGRRLDVELTWDVEAYPYLRYWCDNHPESYTTALEPASHLFDGFTDSKRYGTYWHLEPGEARDAWIECKLFAWEDWR